MSASISGIIENKWSRESLQEYSSSPTSLSSHFTNKSADLSEPSLGDNSKHAQPLSLTLTKDTPDITTSQPSYSIKSPLYSNNTPNISPALSETSNSFSDIKLKNPDNQSMSNIFGKSANEIIDSDKYTGKTSLVLNGLSYHVGQRTMYNSDQPWNEVNEGIGLETRLNETTHITVGNYNNSIGEVSSYATIGWETDGNKILGAGLQAGIVTGYPAAPVLPMALPYVRIGERDEANLQMGLIPPVEADGFKAPAVVTLSARVPF